jgi:hypothetical protein
MKRIRGLLAIIAFMIRVTVRALERSFLCLNIKKRYAKAIPGSELSHETER